MQSLLKYLFTSFSFLLLIHVSFPVRGQLPNYPIPQEFKDFPVHPKERSFSGITNPPKSKLRTMAEWEEIDAILISWSSHFSILGQIVKYAQEECEVLIVCNDSNSVKNFLSGQSIITYNVKFIEAPFNSIWSRDYGQWSAYTNDVDSLVFIDWIYNRPRPLDDDIPELIANHFNVPVYNMTQAPYDLVHTGGNFMVDGLGTGFSSKLVLDENNGGMYNITDKSSAEIDTLIRLFMGIDRFIKMDKLQYDLIHHIDMHMKLLDEETILVGEYPAGVSDGPQIEANIQYIKDNFMSVFGTPYRFIRIQMPPENGVYPVNGGDYRTYTNAVIINKTILVPTYEPQYDDTALEIWKKAMPGYRIKGINSNSIIPLSGAIHCITKAVGSNDPMLIVHQPVRDVQAAGNPANIEATIKHRSGILSARVYYTSDTHNLFVPVNMTLSDPVENKWTASIPGHSNGEEIYYYISATANNGKMQSRPMPAPKGYWQYNISEMTAIEEVEINRFELGEIYPNPATAITVIPLEISRSGVIDIRIYDLPGREIMQVHHGLAEAGKKNYYFDASRLSTGTYILRVSNNNQPRVAKFSVKQ